MDLCPACGHDYDLDGVWSGFCHYVKGSDPKLGFSRPLCNEGYEPIISPEIEEAIDELSQRLVENMTKMLAEIQGPLSGHYA